MHVALPAAQNLYPGPTCFLSFFAASIDIILADYPTLVLDDG